MHEIHNLKNMFNHCDHMLIMMSGNNNKSVIGCRLLEIWKFSNMEDFLLSELSTEIIYNSQTLFQSKVKLPPCADTHYMYKESAWKLHDTQIIILILVLN